LLDLFCCDGGAAAGYARAGFEVVGVDIRPTSVYPGKEFFECDALWFLGRYGHEFDFVHTSPPCQGEGAPIRGTNAKRGNPHPRLIEPTRNALKLFTRAPWVIENVAGAAIRKDLMLCGEMFGLGVIMHRFFEFGHSHRSGSSIPAVIQPKHKSHRGRVRGWRHGVYHDGPYVAAYGRGGGKATVAEMQQAKGIDWTDDHLALREALPPVYTEYIGQQVLQLL
jgi:hypothetical protein